MTQRDGSLPSGARTAERRGHPGGARPAAVRSSATAATADGLAAPWSRAAETPEFRTGVEQESCKHGLDH